jgi:hypothetical protein
VPDEKTITLVDPDGVARPVAEADVQTQLDRGWHIEGAEEHADRLVGDVEKEIYGGPAGTVVAGAAGLARGLSGGGSDVVLAGLGAGDALRKLQRQNPVTSTITEIGGGLSPAGFGGLATRAGKAAVRGIEGASTVSRIAKAGAATAIEGGIQGFGSGVSELALSDDPITLERLASVPTSHALFGAGIGGVAGGLGKAAEVGLQRAKRGIDTIATRARAASDTDAIKAAIPDELTAYTANVREANPYLVVDSAGSAKISKSDRVFRDALDTPNALAMNPSSLAKPLERQETALLKAIGQRDELLAKFEAANGKISKEVNEAIKLAPEGADIELTGPAMKRYAGFTDTKITKKTTSLSVPREAAQNFAAAIESGAVKGSAQKSLDKLDGLLEQNRALQTRIKSTQGGPAVAPQQGMFGEMIKGSIFGHVAGALSGFPVIGPMAGAAVAKAAGNLAVGKLGKASAELADRTSRGIDSFLDVSRKVAPRVPVLATKTLDRLRFAPTTEKADAVPTKAKPTLAELFKARSSEIRSQTAYGLDGKPVMRPEARKAMAAQLAGVRAHDPLAADRLESIIARRLEYLAGKLPRRPDIGGIPLGPDRWQPSDLEMRSFARTAAAVEDPAGIVERLANGSITPEDADVMREVYPATMADIKRRIIERLPDLRQSLPYERRVALSIFSGVPVDPAMRPDILGVLQGQFESEEGSEGGTVAPKAAPQFGSISKSVPEPTPAQDRAG